MKCWSLQLNIEHNWSIFNKIWNYNLCTGLKKENDFDDILLNLNEYINTRNKFLDKLKYSIISDLFSLKLF